MIQFRNILDQHAAIAWLQRAHAADRLPHGLIFAGPVGVGKATTAAVLGALLLCEHPKKDDACGQCDSCRVLAAGNHPDFRVITKELIRQYDRSGTSKAVEFSIHVIRPELVDRAGRKAMLGRGKIFIIEQAELLTSEAQNAMLKTLEEPAERTVIILLTDQPGQLLPTIRSRCQLVRFAPLSEETVKTELANRKIDKKTATLAAKLAQGSLGTAIKWIDEGVVRLAEEWIEKLDTLIAGKPVPTLAEWLKKAADAYAEKQIERDELSSKAQASRDGLAVYLRIAAEHFRGLLASGRTPAQLEPAASAIDSIIRAEQYLDSYVNTPLVLQQLSLSMESAFALNH